MTFGKMLSVAWVHSFFGNQTSIGAVPDIVVYGPDTPYNTVLDTFTVKYQRNLSDSLLLQLTANYSTFEIENDSRFLNSFTNFDDVGYKYSTAYMGRLLSRRLG